MPFYRLRLPDRVSQKWTLKSEEDEAKPGLKDAGDSLQRPRVRSPVPTLPFTGYLFRLFHLPGRRGAFPRQLTLLVSPGSV